MFRLQRLEITGFKSFADYTEIVFTDSGITAVVGPNGCGKCVSGDTLITLPDGSEKPIRDLVDNTLNGCFLKEKFDDGFLTRENHQNIEILSLNPKTLKIERRKVSAFIKRTATPKLLNIRTKSGRKIKATPYHPLFTLENGVLRTLRADELKKGISIAVPRVLPVSKKNIEFSRNDYFSLFELKDNVYIPFSDVLKNWTDEGKKSFGSFTNWSEAAGISNAALTGLRGNQSINISNLNRLAQNFYSDPPFSFRINSKGSGSINLPEKFSPDLAKFLGLLIAEGRSVSNNTIWFVNSEKAINREYTRLAREIFGVRVSSKNYKNQVTDNLIFSKSLCRILDRLFCFEVGSNSFEKQIPPQILEAEPEVKWAFLSGLFEGDAYVCARTQKNNGKFLTYIEYTTASEKLAGQIISLLMQLGIFAYLRPKQKYASNTAEKKVRTYYSVLIYGSNQLKYIAENLKFVGKKQAALEKLKSIRISKNPNYDLVPSANELVREAVRLSDVKIKPNRKKFPKLAAYTQRTCQPSRMGLSETVEQIKTLSNNFAPAGKHLEHLSTLADSDVFWDKIESVEEILPDEEWVYDLSVNETHNFVANNIIVHNSNVSDAFSWVLGEQRAKSLRGEEMKDVIFQGASKRGASGMAEVVLHLIRDETAFDFEEAELEGIDETLSELDENAIEIGEIQTQNGEVKAEENGFHTEEIEVETVQAAQVGSIQTIEIKKPKRHWKPRSIALDFMPGEAVSVTRRLHLSGESEYLLNNKACRLRDIQDLFSGTGLSGAHYAIIEQGRIGQILSAKPSDRRNLIEEAAGISKFRTRQRAAETRLESAKLNLQRISDIVSEIEKQANSLRRQAAKTRRYKILREELREILLKVFTAEGKYLSDLFEDLEVKLDEAARREREVFAAVGEKEEAFREATIKAREAEENLSEIRTRHSENALERDRASREFRYQEEQITNLKQRSAVLQNEIETTETRLKLIKSELERLTKDERKEREEAGRAELGFREIEKKYQAKARELNETESEMESERAELLQHATAVERLTEVARQLENTAERLKERSEGLRREGERAEETFAEHKQNSENLETSLITEREKLENLQNEKTEIRQTVEQAKTVLLSSEARLKTLREEFARKRNRLETLQELEEKRAIYAPSIQKLFAEQKKIGVELQGILADKFHVDEKAEKAVESLFGSFLQAVLVKTETDARKLIDFLNANNFGRIAVLVQSSKFKVQSSNSQNKNQQSIANLIGVSDEIAAVLAEVFPREMSAELAESFDKIKAKGDEVFVTSGGDLNIGGKLFVGGKSGANEKNGSLLAFKRELRELETATNKLNKEIEKAEKETGKARAALTEKEDKLVDLQSLIVKVERELLAREIEAKSLAQEIERARRHQRVVSEEARQIESEIGDIRRKQSEAKTNAEKAEKARLAAAEKLEKTTQKLNKIRQSLEAENAVLNEKRTLAATSEERRRSAANSLKRVENERAELEERISRLNFETAENRGKSADLNNLLADLKQKITSAETDLEKEQIELDLAKQHLAETRERADAKSAELAELNKQSAEARNERAALEIRQTETMTRLKSLKESCAQDLNLSLVELIENEEVESDFDLEDAKNRTQDLRQKLENFGAINMLALEELSEVEERFLFLTAQQQDILDSIAAAEEALQEIKQRSREKFREAFHAINRNFVEYFQELFGGGRGEMMLLEAEDVLEAGIEIVAQPPGKRLQSILLLSGGEKAMTAIALVLAIFKYRPAPFCLLDEVDAPLDDANVGRFVNKIAEMSEKTQFIVITHNKRTMEAARALYGVTMQEAGVSKVVSVKFD